MGLSGQFPAKQSQVKAIPINDHSPAAPTRYAAIEAAIVRNFPARSPPSSAFSTAALSMNSISRKHFGLPFRCGWRWSWKKKFVEK
jgi:hypothetical protein